MTKRKGGSGKDQNVGAIHGESDDLVYSGPERRRGVERRSGKDRRTAGDPYYIGPERRSGVERRSGKDRRKLTIA